MHRQHLIFDLDDTLSYCNKYFDEVLDQFIEEMVNEFEGISRDEVRELQLAIDLKQVDANGLTTNHFPESFVRVYEKLCSDWNMPRDEAQKQFLYRLGQSVFEMPVEAMPDMNETLERLKTDGYELYLHTGGEEKNQRRKIAQLELAAYFDNRIFISLHKNTAALQSIIEQIPADRRHLWMIGNSPRTDMIPALEAGINAIYIPAASEWSFNMAEIDVRSERVFLTLERLSDVPEAIRRELGRACH